MKYNIINLPSQLSSKRSCLCHGKVPDKNCVSLISHAERGRSWYAGVSCHSSHTPPGRSPVLISSSWHLVKQYFHTDHQQAYWGETNPPLFESLALTHPYRWFLFFNLPLRDYNNCNSNDNFSFLIYLFRIIIGVCEVYEGIHMVALLLCYCISDVNIFLDRNKMK